MKKHPFRSILAAACILAAALALPACNNTGTTSPTTGSPTPTASPVTVSPATVQASAQFATVTALTFDKNAKVDGAMAYTAAAALNSLATGQNFTPAEVSATLQSFGGKNPPPYYSLIVTGVSAVWSGVFPNLPKDGKSAAVYLAALAAGVQAGAAQYAPATASGTP